MRRSRRSSSSDSISSNEKSSKYRHRRQRSSSSSSSERSKRNRNKKSHKRNRHRSDSSRSSSSSSRSSDKHSKYSKKNRRHSSSSPDTKSRLIDLNMKREKNYEFDDGLTELYKNEQTRRNQISKIDDDGGGFKPKAFKSSRSTQKTAPKLSKEQEHDNAIFGPVTSKSEASLPSQPVQVNVVSSHVKSLMHESLFEDINAKEKRWKLKLLELIKSN